MPTNVLPARASPITGWPVIFKNKIPGFSRFFSDFWTIFQGALQHFQGPFTNFTKLDLIETVFLSLL